MAKKVTETKTTKKPAVAAAPAKAVSTPVRNTPIPKIAAKKAAAVEITSEMIAKRAYEIYASGKGGSESDNWFAAERDLRAGI